MAGTHRTAYVGFGANLGDPLDTYHQATQVLEAKLGRLTAESWMYESKALTLSGTESQSNYINSVLAFETTLSPREILTALLETELQFKRDRKDAARWAPRPIDLDVLFVDDLVVEEPGLTVPHPELHKRDFVLCPLVDIAPDFKHPLLHQTIETLESSLEERGFQRFVIGRTRGALLPSD